uniref:Uncharacterized protein n=1 Tax=viral metagenome TaxID=1070528 RepID=A0A6M3K7U7_9ZZZZ
MTVGQDTPNVIRGAQEDYRRLYYSEPKASLVVPVALQAGYGVVHMGQALAKNSSAAGNINKLIPYDPYAVTGVEEDHPRLYLVTDGVASVYAYVTIEDSYKVIVADDTYAMDSDLSAVDTGAVVAIDVTTYSHMAKLTLTNQVTTAITTAKFGYLYVEGAGTAVGIMQKSVNTGLGINAKGAGGTIILGNCVLYSGALRNVDSAARTDLSASTYGNFTYIR